MVIISLSLKTSIFSLRYSANVVKELKSKFWNWICTPPPLLAVLEEIVYPAAFKRLEIVFLVCPVILAISVMHLPCKNNCSISWKSTWDSPSPP